ncbi:MAG: ABC transporter permease [Gemmataceae bacterium]|nr:ABC transporter permease [Gemmata sp.]MDW8197891.1 ABC transporter permease [Gemmataceae bacterium]
MAREVPDALHTHPRSEQPSVVRAFGVLVVQSFQRHWRIRQMGWVALGLLALIVFWVALVTQRNGWNLAERRVRRTTGTYQQEALRLLPTHRYWAATGDEEFITPPRPYEIPNPLQPTEEAFRSLILSIPYAVLQSDQFLYSWSFMTYSRWVMHLVFLGFALPLFTLSYASGAFGSDRESRVLIWLMTRPIPRSGIYLAKFLGTLPWCLLWAMGGFVAIGYAGGAPGREALSRYWPAALMATLAFASLFHLMGAIFRRPVVVGLVYVFFFEAVVAALPGSLKLLSLTFYARSLMYNEAAEAGYPVELLPAMTEAVSSPTAWAVLTLAIVGLNGFGMWLFARWEYRDDT